MRKVCLTSRKIVHMDVMIVITLQHISNKLSTEVTEIVLIMHMYPMGK